MKKTALITAILAAGIFLFITSCQKDKSIKEFKPYLTKATTELLTKTYSYDAQNRFSEGIATSASRNIRIMVTQYDGNSNITSYQELYSDRSNISVYSISYDTRNRPVSIVITDSVNGGISRLLATILYAYTGNIIIKQVQNSTAVTTLRETFTFNESGNLIEERTFDARGINLFNYYFTDYDTKTSHDQLTPFIFSERACPIASANNCTKYSRTNLGTGVTANFEVGYTYNSDSLPALANHSSSTVSFQHTYTYENK